MVVCMRCGRSQRRKDQSFSRRTAEALPAPLSSCFIRLLMRISREVVLEDTLFSYTAKQLSRALSNARVRAFSGKITHDGAREAEWQRAPAGSARGTVDSGAKSYADVWGRWGEGVRGMLRRYSCPPRNAVSAVARRHLNRQFLTVQQTAIVFPSR